MTTAYATAELSWPSGLKKVSQQGRFCTPAHFENDNQNNWSLCLWFDRPINPGEVVTVPITPLVSEAAEKLLLPGAGFRLFLGRDCYAEGRIVKVQQVSSEEMRRIFHLPEHYV